MSEDPDPGDRNGLHEGDSVTIDFHPGQGTGIIEAVNGDGSVCVKVDGEDEAIRTLPRQWVHRN